MSDKKFTRYDWDRFEEWKRYLWATRPKLPKGCRRPHLILFCLALTQNSSAGLDCFTSNKGLEDMTGIARRHIARYRWLAVELGWFVQVGQAENRVPHYRINIPLTQQEVLELPESLREGSMKSPVQSLRDPDPWGDDKHDPWKCVMDEKCPDPDNCTVQRD